MIGIGASTGAYWFLAALLPALASADADVDPRALALLRGVESVRTRDRSLRVELTIEYVSPPSPRASVRCLVECDGDKRRFEQLPGDQFEGEVIVVDAGQVREYLRGQYNDVCLYDMEYAVFNRGDLAFDPRILGLSDLMPADATVKAYLGYEKARKIEVLGKEVVDGANVWRVKITRDSDSNSQFWIEEPSFRVRRNTDDWKRGHVEIRSRFDVSDNTSYLPTRVEIERFGPDGEIKRKQNIVVTNVEYSPKIPAERFSLKGMDLPLNTPVVDYRIHRRIGFWDGEGLSEHPVSPTRPAPERSRPMRHVFMALVGLALIATVVVLLIRRRVKSR